MGPARYLFVSALLTQAAAFDATAATARRPTPTGGKAMERPKEMILEGVKKLRYHGDPKVDRFVFALDNVMQYLGEEDGYTFLLGASGRAFKAVWHDHSYFPERHKGADQKARPMEFHDFPSVRAAVEATGYGFEMLCNRDGPSPYESDAFTSSVANTGIRQAMLESIGVDKRPVLALMHLNTRTDWRILTGYTDDGDQVLGWPGSHAKRPEAEPFELKHDGTFSSGEWERRVVVLIRLVGEKDPGYGKKKRDLYKRALELALQCSKPKIQGTTASGPAAYDSCLEALGEDDRDVSDDAIRERLGYFGMVFIGDMAANRHAASEFFTTMRKGRNASALLHAAGNCAKIHELAWECWQVAGGFWRKPETEIPRFRDKESRKQIMDIVREMKALEEDTAKQIGIALEGWDKTHRDYMQAE